MPSRPSFFPRLAVVAGTTSWDWALLPLVLPLLVAPGFGASQMARPCQLGDVLPVTLDAAQQPYYLLRTLLRTLLRMLAALVCSLVFAAGFALLAR